MQGNYVMESEAQLEGQQEEFDMILCLSLTKWVHLNWGDDGVRLLFKRMFRQLRPGGRMLLEAQPFHSYAKKKKLTVSSAASLEGATTYGRGNGFQNKVALGHGRAKR